MAVAKTRFNLLYLVFLICVSVFLMIADYRFQYVQSFRSTLSYAVKPVLEIANLPSYIRFWLADFSRSESELTEAYRQLRTENVVLLSKLRKAESINKENDRLRRLLGASEKVAERVLLAELKEVSLEPFTHAVVINKGLSDGVYIGQAVIDTHGLMGQVTAATPFDSSVTLLTDPNHAIPVQVQRNSLRVVVNGTGNNDSLDVPNLAHHADIGSGDLLVTSGMGGRFPFGHPVAVVTEVLRDPNEAFLTVKARPVAELDKAREVLLIWQERQSFNREAQDNGDPAAAAPSPRSVDE